jgi:hypothetical protein
MFTALHRSERKQWSAQQYIRQHSTRMKAIVTKEAEVRELYS